jgi:hypothetical protein
MIQTCSRFLLLIILVFISTFIFHASSAWAQDGNDDVWVSAPALPVHIDTTLMDLPAAEIWQEGDPIRPAKPKRISNPDALTRPVPDFVPQRDPLVDLQIAVSKAANKAFSTQLVNVAGQGFGAGFPADTVGQIGSTHYLQLINNTGGSSVQAYDKTTGVPVLGAPATLAPLAPNGDPCRSGAGDPVPLFDTLANRWVLTEFVDGNVGFHLCMYVSSGADPTTSTWTHYRFDTPNFPDYPKYSVWPDAYYIGTNEGGTTAVYAVDRNAMLAGSPATMIRRTTAQLPGFGFQIMVPADLDGSTAPPAGSPGIFIRHRDDESHDPPGTAGSDKLELFEFTPDFTTPANSTFTGPTNILVAEFESELCGLVSFECFPQPGTGVTLDPLREPIMHRPVYRNFGTHQALVGNFTTDVDGGAANRGGVRWFELRRTAGTTTGGWGLHQEGTVSAADGLSRWMGSIAMDKEGNVALGYSTSGPGAGQFPSIAYTGRESSDPAGTMPQAETVIVAGGASQTLATRWGDYSALTIDPVDNCTFWYTNMYVPAASGGLWATQIASFRFDSCSGTPPTCYALTTTHTGSGADPVASPTNSAGCAAGSYTAGAAINVTAAPDGGWTVDSWVGTNNNGSTSTGNTVTMPAGPHTVTVNYAAAPPTCYALARTHTGSGTDPVATPTNSTGCTAGTYIAGEAINVTATPDGGWSVGSWVGTNNNGSTATSNTVTMPAGPHMVTVNYVAAPPTCYALTRTHTGSGTDPVATPTNSSACGAGTYIAGEAINVTATPDGGWSVGSWVGTNNNASTSTSNTVTMPAGPHTVTVNYVAAPPTCYALTRTHTGSGADPVAAPANSSGCGAGSYIGGEVINVTAAPDGGWNVGSWSGTNNNASTSTGNTVTMPAGPHSVTVNYVEAVNEVTFQFTFCSSVNTGASARGYITFDGALMQNPFSGSIAIPGPEILDLSVTVSGAAAGNGSYGMNEFSSIYWDSEQTLLDLGIELVGQPTLGLPWGTIPSNADAGDFNLFANGAGPGEDSTTPALYTPEAPGAPAGAPVGGWFFTLIADGGQADRMVIKSMVPGAPGNGTAPCVNNQSLLINEVSTKTGENVFELFNPTASAIDLIDYGVTAIGSHCGEKSYEFGSFLLAPGSHVAVSGVSCWVPAEIASLELKLLATSEGHDFVRWGGVLAGGESGALPSDGTVFTEFGGTKVAAPPNDNAVIGRNASSLDTNDASDWCVQTPSMGAVNSDCSGETELKNLSTRADVGTGPDIAIAGFILSGNEDKCVVVRGRGPSMAVNNVPKLQDPNLTIYSGQTIIASNDNWMEQADPAHKTIIENLGLAPPDFRESAVYLCLPNGPFTGLLRGGFGGTGVGIVEVFDADDGTAIMENISTRARVGSGPLVTIGGFIIEGIEPKKILLRGRGPTVGVPDGVVRLSDPRLRLYQLLPDNSNVLLEENDNWQQGPNAAEIAASGQAPGDPREAATLRMMHPGVYTGILDGGPFGFTGSGIIEVIDLSGSTPSEIPVDSGVVPDVSGMIEVTEVP